jgi:hypothetical protein
MVGQSLDEPITTATSGLSFTGPVWLLGEFALAFREGEW